MDKKLSSTKYNILCLAPILLTLTVTGVYGILYNVFTLCEFPPRWCETYSALKSQITCLLPTEPNMIEAVRMQAFAGRITWAITIGMTILLSLVGIATVFYVIFRSKRYYSKKRLTWISIYFLGPLASAIAIYILLAGFGKGSDPWRSFIHGYLIEDVRVAESITVYLDIFGAILALYIAAAAVSILGPFKNEYKKWLKDLRSHSICLRLILYTGAALLLVNVLRSASILNWSLDYVDASFFADESPRLLAYKGVNKLIKVMVTSRGFLYSFLLAFLYIPPAFLLRFEAGKKASKDKMNENESKIWLSGFNVFHGISNVGAILSPFLGGLITDFLFRIS